MKYLIEVGIVVLLLTLFARVLHGWKNVLLISKYYATIFAVAFLYVPIAVMWIKKRQMDFLDTSVSMFVRGIIFFALTALIVFPPYALGAHLWMMFIWGRQGFSAAPFPDLWQTVVFQILLIALPEEFLFRGYMQGTLNKVFTGRKRFFGASIGWALPITSVVFAFAHSFVHYEWWHFSIFFPALLFGWLREKTGSITAPILFHAASNILSDWIARSYF
ncbi:MAG: CPBP family intramembrane metalloprotease [Deltaproteobacteria bacterium]|nr:CPBP family intramembrane metalloprotease [Deltaproteobacteria bacterium]MBI2974151.1 CPBP family intramembrane metalloprotease [Deltaproteobacteria bacterium]